MSEQLDAGAIYRRWPDGYEVHRMSPDDARQAERWFCDTSTVAQDLEVALSAYPRQEDGFYSGYLDGQMVSSAIRIPVCDGVYYGSHYFVDEKHRLKGLGKRIRDEVATPRVGSNILAIDAIEHVEEMNKRRGYKSSGKVSMFAGIPSLEQLSASVGDITTVEVKDLKFDDLISYDNKAFIRPDSPLRRALLEKWVQIPGGVCLAAVNKDGGLTGYGCRRPGLTKGTHMIGPLYADSFDVAARLFYNLCEGVQNEDVSISIHESHGDAVRLVQTVSLEAHLHMIRMYLNGQVQHENPRVFGVTSVEVCGF